MEKNVRCAAYFTRCHCYASLFRVHPGYHGHGPGGSARGDGGHPTGVLPLEYKQVINVVFIQLMTLESPSVVAGEEYKELEEEVEMPYIGM